MMPIEYRSENVNNEEGFRHFESDSVICRNQLARFSVQYEKLAQLLRFHRVRNKSAEATREAKKATIESVKYELFESITYDRDSEGELHWKLRLDYGIDTFHCALYCSWQKGVVENVNGSVSRYLPNLTKLSQYSNGDLLVIREKINSRPRRGLGWKTIQTSLIAKFLIAPIVVH